MLDFGFLTVDPLLTVLVIGVLLYLPWINEPIITFVTLVLDGAILLVAMGYFVSLCVTDAAEPRLNQAFAIIILAIANHAYGRIVIYPRLGIKPAPLWNPRRR